MNNKAKNKKSNILIVYTGGTIGMAPVDNTPGSPLEPKSLEQLKEYAPILGGNADIEFGEIAFEPPLDSSNIEPKHWLEMAEIIESNYEKYDSFIILHGTDTMCYTSSMLAFMFENLSKPVVVTGSQMPIYDYRTDAVMNLNNAVHVAAYKAFGLPLIPEVIIVFGDKIIRGCRATKVSTTSWAGFDSPNFPLLGNIGERINIRNELLAPSPLPSQHFHVNKDIVDKVMDIAIFPGLKPSQLKYALNPQDIEAVVLRTYGAGNAPENRTFLKTIEDLIKLKKTVVNTTQCLQGLVAMGLYQASSGLLERGVISGMDMTPEATLTKLMWTLGAKVDEQQIQLQMQVSQRGEQSENLFDLRFGGCGNEEEPQEAFTHYMTPDRRFDVKSLTRAVVRIKGLVPNAGKQSYISVRVFVNFPRASHRTPVDHPKCVINRRIFWDGEPINLIEILDDQDAQTTIGDNDITLTVLLEDNVSFSFEGLYLALYAKADY